MGVRQTSDDAPAGLSKAAFLIASSLLFLVIFEIRYAMIDPVLYETRDDGVITMSVGKNIADHGFAGVSPSGPIVEASSSPLQTLSYAAAYALTGVGYAGYAKAQTMLATAALGALFALAIPASGVLGLGMLTATALALSFVYPFFLWHGSGMENALTHVFFLGSVVGCVQMMHTGRVRWLWAVPVALTLFCRLELIIPIAILLAGFSAAWLMRWRSLGAFAFSCGIALSWGLGHGVRIWYFGDFFPNTAVAQAISPLDRLALALSGDADVWRTARFVLAANAVGNAWWLAAIGLLGFAIARARTWPFLVTAALLVFAATAVLPFLLGLPRIEATRTYSHLTPIAAALCLGGVHAALRRGDVMARGLAIAAAAAIALGLSGNRPYYLGWDLADFAAKHTTFKALANEQALPRPLVANPDLGVISWHKDLNMFDIASLGSPIFAALDAEGRSDFMFDLALPDLIESHGFWTRLNCDAIFLDPRFEALYAPIGRFPPASEFCDDAEPPEAYWIRRDILKGSPSAERTFVDAVAGSLTLDAFEAELAACSAADADCAYVARTAFRYMPELRAAGLAKPVAQAFEDPVLADYLSTWHDVGAVQRIIAAFVREAGR